MTAEKKDPKKAKYLIKIRLQREQIMTLYNEISDLRYLLETERLEHQLFYENIMRQTKKNTAFSLKKIFINLKNRIWTKTKNKELTA